MPRIYLAAPIFTPEQIEVVNLIKAVAEGRQHDVFSPYHNSQDIFAGRKPSECTSEEREKVLADNIYYLDWCDVVVAWIGGMGGFTDPGVVWELGYARSGGKFQIAFADETDERKGMNLMLAGTIDAFCTGLPELTTALTELGRPGDQQTVSKMFDPATRLAAEREPVV